MGEQKVQNGQEQDLGQLLKVRRDKLAELQAKGQDPFRLTKYDVTHHSQEIKDSFEELEGKTVTIAGRMMSKRIMGKASFCNVQDLQGNIQCYVARDVLGQEPYQDFKKYDIGDIIGVRGEVFRTKTGEISIHAAEITLLSKSLQILPEKFHGLTNTDVRYRQRYTDLIMNSEVKDTFIKRSRILSSIRRYLDSQGFLEVETPMLVANAGGAAARPFETHFNALDEDFKLRISLELYLKRLIVGGLERVYEIGRVFRNGGTGYPPQSGVYPDGTLPGVYGLPRHDGSDGEPLPHGGPGGPGNHEDRVQRRGDGSRKALRAHHYGGRGEEVFRRGLE